MYQPYEHYEEAARKLTEQTVENIIRKYTNVPFSSDIDIRRTDDGTIEILHVSVIFEALPEYKKELTEELQKELGIIPEIGEKNRNE